ncbi:hypothetical protein DFQ26_001454, partial [Actinomortierella ambigua]
MLEFAAKHNVRPWIETMPMSDANAAIKKAMDGFPRYLNIMIAEAVGSVPAMSRLEISLYGICRSDIHTITEGWGPLCHGPCNTGHEIIGHVVARGDKVSAKLSHGDRVGVGAMVDSCNGCELCQQGLDQQCKKMAFANNDTLEEGRPGVTYGGYADRIRVPAEWTFKILRRFHRQKRSAPLLCAGVTTYAPLARYGAGPTKRVGVLGLGGLGHLGVQFARAFSSKEVVVVSTSDSKRAEAEKLGVTRFINSHSPEQMAANAGTIDPVVGDFITEETLDFAAKHNVRPWIEKMPMSDANAAVKLMMGGRPRYRIVMYTDAAKE